METTQHNFINVPLLEPKLKHPTIFRVFDGLTGGETLTIHNDHDPKPVYYQLLGERGDVFTWQYLNQGPEWWDVLITKKSDNDKETIGQIAVKDLRKAEVFKKYGIDFCCGGKKTIRQVCAEKGIDATKVEQELQMVNSQHKTESNAYNEWGLDFLADYIVNTHHRYVRKYLPEISAYSMKVARVHGDRHTELREVQELVWEISEALTEHMAAEENILFSNVKKIVRAREAGLHVGKEQKILSALIEELEQEHDLVGRCFDKLRAITDGYTLPDDACASYQLLFKMLQEFEDDLHMHIHLENNILFPKAVELGKL